MKRENPKRKADRIELAWRAVILYNGGMTLRAIGKEIGRSHEWVRKAVDEMLKEKPKGRKQ